MKRTKLKYLFAPIWILNMVFLFGSLYSIFSNKEGKLSIIYLGIIGLFFVFYIYLLNDILQFKRPLFLKIISIVLILSGIFYILTGALILTIPTIASGIFILKRIDNA